LSEFESDGCTGWFDLNYRACCVDHDFAEYSGISDYIADINLLECVGSLGHPVMAVMMFAGVKLFRPAYRLIRPFIR
jgi:hypothetical protein